jgi:hypothetical protein
LLNLVNSGLIEALGRLLIDVLVARYYNALQIIEKIV